VTAEILAAVSPGEVRVAAVRDGMLVDYAIWRPGTPDGVGDLHRGRMLAHMPALGGAFVALAGSEGFLPDTEQAERLPEGAIIGVRVIRAAQGGKGPRLTAQLSEEERQHIGQGPPQRLRRGPDAVQRLATLHPDAQVWVDDAALLAEMRPALRDRVGLRVPVWREAVISEIEALADPVALLPGPGPLSASFHPTPALTAVDLDTAAATRGRGQKAALQLALNRAALPELARQIRLRNLSGAILVDLAGLSPRRRAALAPDFIQALAADPLGARLLGFTALGLAEIVRPRVHPPLHELLSGPLAAGLAALRCLAIEAVVRPAWTAKLRTAPAVANALRRDPVALPDLARRTGRTLMLREDASLAPFGWEIEE
jgi:Ribonuclease G/E